MAWNIAVVVDPEFNERAADQLVRYRPIWMVDTPHNRISAAVARAAAGEMWDPEAACTTYRIEDPSAREHNCLHILDMIDLHHPHLAKLDVIGVGASASLTLGMSESGFFPAISTLEDSIAFRRSIDALEGVPSFDLDASAWKSPDDVYNSLFAKLGSPVWHGRNFNALNDSIVTGGINSVDVPFKLLIHGLHSSTNEVKEFVSKLEALLAEREAEGCPISVRIDG